MKEKYEQPLLTRHEKLLDITGNFGSGKGKESSESGDSKRFHKESKEWFKETKDDGW